MSSLNAISLERHGSKRWVRRTSFGFTASVTVTPLVAEELSSAVLALPIAFIPVDDGFTLAAVMGLAPGQNLLLSDEGHWIGHYIPASFRTDPFYLLPDENGRLVLCIDESSGVISDAPHGEPFFTDEGEPSQGINEILALLNQISISRNMTKLACEAISKYKLIQPWQITLEEQSGEKKVEGLFRIDEQALNALSAEDFLALREAGAFPIIYGQLFSTKNLKALGGLYSRRAESDIQAAKSSNGIGDTFSF